MKGGLSVSLTRESSSKRAPLVIGYEDGSGSEESEGSSSQGDTQTASSANDIDETKDGGEVRRERMKKNGEDKLSEIVSFSLTHSTPTALSSPTPTHSTALSSPNHSLSSYEEAKRVKRFRTKRMSTSSSSSSRRGRERDEGEKERRRSPTSDDGEVSASSLTHTSRGDSTHTSRGDSSHSSRGVRDSDRRHRVESNREAGGASGKGERESSVVMNDTRTSLPSSSPSLPSSPSCGETRDGHTIPPVCWKSPTKELGLSQETSQTIQGVAYELLRRNDLRLIKRCEQWSDDTSCFTFLHPGSMEFRYFKYIIENLRSHIRSSSFTPPPPLGRGISPQGVRFLSMLDASLHEAPQQTMDEESAEALRLRLEERKKRADVVAAVTAAARRLAFATAHSSPK